MIETLLQASSTDDGCLSAACPGALAGSALTFRAQPEDFIVEEIPAYLPSGEGEHLYLWVEKRGISTRALVQGLCAQLRLDEREVGYAGQKDERAVARQWLSLPKRKADLDKLAIDGVKVLEAKPHGNKLRLGHLRGNRFTVVLSGEVDAAALQARTAAVVDVPNLFGGQRFGREGRTLQEAARFLERRRKATSRRERFWISAVQSALFNGWLWDRTQDGCWHAPLAGDVLLKTDNGAPFQCVDPATDGARMAAGDVVVGGPLVGAGMRPASLAALTAESRSWQRLGVDVAALCEHPAFDVGARRPASIRPGEVAVAPAPAGVSLGFSLPKGCYASVVLKAWLGAAMHDAAFVDGEGDTNLHAS